jgi:hypothetical protein
MKAFILQIILFTFCHTSEYKLDLDNSGKNISKYLKDLPRTIDQNTGKEHIGYMKSFNTTVNDTVQMFYLNAMLALNVPSLSIYESNNTRNYSLKVANCTDCLLFDYIPEVNGNFDINCTYNNNKLNTYYFDNMTDSLNDRSNYIYVAYNVRFTANGGILLSDIKGSTIDSQDLNDYTKDYYPLVNKTIHQIFVFNHYLNILVENDLLIIKYNNTFSNPFVQYDLIDISQLDKTKVIKSIYSYAEKNKTYVFCDNGFYDLERVHGAIRTVYINSIASGSTDLPIVLNDIDTFAHANNRTFIALIAVKNQGLLWVDLINNYSKVFFLKHDCITGLQPSQNRFNSLISLGVSVNNTNPLVGEFFIEFILDLNDYNSLSISRVFLASNYIKIIKTAYDSDLTMFLSDKRLYLVPRNIYLKKTLPVYYYDVNAKYSDMIPYINWQYYSMLKLLSNQNHTLVVDKFFSGLTENPHFDCRFNNPGSYDIRIGGMNTEYGEQVFQFVVDIYDNGTHTGISTFMITLIVIGVIVLIFAVISMIYYYRKRNRNVIVYNQYSLHQ